MHQFMPDRAKSKLVIVHQRLVQSVKNGETVWICIDRWCSVFFYF